MKQAILRAGIFAVLIITLLSVNSCSGPSGKDEYLNRFERFVDNVRKDHGHYNRSDWKYADERFNKFSNEWYEKFRDELTLNDEVKIASLIAQYQSYKGAGILKEFYDKNMKEDVDSMKAKIKYYIDHDMDDDLKKLKQGAKEISDSTFQVVKQIIDSLRK
jgi:Domain of unknown function (DUF6565)